MVCRGHMFGNGIIMRAVGDRMIIAPPLVMTRAQIDDRPRAAIRRLEGGAVLVAGYAGAPDCMSLHGARLLDAD